MDTIIFFMLKEEQVQSIVSPLQEVKSFLSGLKDVNVTLFFHIEILARIIQ